MCLQFGRSGVEVWGLDIDTVKVEAINAGRSYIAHIEAEAIKPWWPKRPPSTDFSHVRRSRTVIICVPTPLSKIAISILKTGGALPPFATRNLVVLESTTYQHDG